LRVEPAGDDDPFEIVAQAGEEQREGTWRVQDAPGIAAVHVIDVDRESHWSAPPHALVEVNGQRWLSRGRRSEAGKTEKEAGTPRCMHGREHGHEADGVAEIPCRPCALEQDAR